MFIRFITEGGSVFNRLINTIFFLSHFEIKMKKISAAKFSYRFLLILAKSGKIALLENLAF